MAFFFYKEYSHKIMAHKIENTKEKKMSRMERIFFIDKMIHDYKKVTTQDVVEEFEVSARMVRNDIMYMKDRLLAPIVYSKDLKGYYYDSPFTILSFADDKMLLTYSFLRSITQTINYIPYISDDIIDAFSQFLSEPYRKLSGKIIYELSQYETINGHIFNIIIKSFMDKKKCLIRYANIKNIKSERVIEPLTMINYEGSWHLIAYCYKAESVREFKFTRMQHVELIDKDFEQSISEQTLKKYLDTGFGIFLNTGGSESLKEVCIRYYGKAFMIMKDQTVHRDQKKVFGADHERGDYVEFAFPVIAFDEILTKVLKYGPNAEVMYPEDFRTMWLDQIKAMATLYL